MSKFGSLFGRNKKSSKPHQETIQTPTNFKEKNAKKKYRSSGTDKHGTIGSYQNQNNTNVNVLEPEAVGYLVNSPPAHNTDQLKYETMKTPRTSQFKPRTTLVEPRDDFPYKLGRESTPRRSTLYHGVDFDQAKYLTEDQLRISIQRPKEDYERPSTSKDYRSSCPYTGKSDLFTEKRVDYGKKEIFDDDENIYNTAQRVSYSDPARKTVVRFRPHSVAHSKPSEMSKLMVFRADQIEHKLVLGKNVHSIPLKHRRHVPTLLTDDGKLLQPVPESNIRKSSLKPVKDATILKVSMAEIESMGKVPRKSIVQPGLDPSRVEDTMPSLRKSIIRDGNERQYLRKSVVLEENLMPSMRKSVVHDGNVRQPIRTSIVRDGKGGQSIRKSIIPAGNLRPSIRKSVVKVGDYGQSMRNSKVQEDTRRSVRPSLASTGETRYSVIRITNNGEQNNQRQSLSQRGTDSEQYNVPVIPARITTSKMIERHSFCPAKHNRAPINSTVSRNSRVLNWSSEDPGRKSVLSTAPNGSRGRKKHSIVVFNVENQAPSIFSKNRYSLPLYGEDSNRVEPHSSKKNSHARSSTLSRGPVLHLRPSNCHEQKNMSEYDQESPLIQKYSEYYSNLKSPAHQKYTSQILAPNLKGQHFDKGKNPPFKNKHNLPENRFSSDKCLAKDFCGLSETQEIKPSNLKMFSNIKTAPSDLENDIDSLCFPNRNDRGQNYNYDSILKW